MDDVVAEVRPEVGRYTVIGFDRMADLLRELAVLERGAPPAGAKSARPEAPPELSEEEKKAPAGEEEDREGGGEGTPGGGEGKRSEMPILPGKADTAGNTSNCRCSTSGCGASGPTGW